MDTRRRRSPLRILAPVALIAFGVALVMIVSSASKAGGGGGGGQSARAAQKARDLGTTGSTQPTTTRRRHHASGALPQRFYIVKSGDTLGKISQITGVSVQDLQNLNPGLDQFSLIAGQKIKLR
jgi:LysM repeat protein